MNSVPLAAVQAASSITAPGKEVRPNTSLKLSANGVSRWPSMNSPRIYTAQQHSFFGEVTSLFVYLASFNTATEAFGHGVTTIPNTPTHTPVLAGRVVNASFPIHELMHKVVRNEWPEEIRVDFSSGVTPIPGSGGIQLQSDAAANLVIQLVGTAFLKYYERNAHRPKNVYSNNQRSWSNEWRFAWLLRNAIAHGDRWAIKDATIPETIWHGVSVSSNDNEKIWFDLNHFIGGGDVLLLLEELDASPI